MSSPRRATRSTRTEDRWVLAETWERWARSPENGDDAAAFELIEQSAALARNVGVPWWEAGMLAELAALSLRAGRSTRPRSTPGVHALATQVGDREGRVFALGLLAVVAAERGQPERAAGCGRDRGRAGARRSAAGAATAEDYKPWIRDVAGPEFERGYAQGRSSTIWGRL